MIFRKLIGLGFLAIMLFAFFGAFGSMKQSRTEAAYMQGYLAGQQTVASEDGTVNTAPSASPYSYDTHYRSHRGFFPGAGLFLCLLPLMFFGFMSMIFGCKKRHWKHGPGGHPWHKHGHCHPRGHGQEQNPENWEGNAKPVWEDDDFEGEPDKDV